MRIQRLLPLLIAALALPLLVPPADAAPRRYGRGAASGRGFEISPYLVFTDFEEAVEIDEEIGVGIRFGYLGTPHHEFEFMVNGVDTDDEFFPGIQVDVTHFQFAYVYNFTRRGVVPYVTAGLGFVTVDDEALGDETNAVLGLGAGVRFFLGPAFFARFEYRHNQFEGDGPVFADGFEVSFRELLFGVGWRFGLP
jgi:opacity protein-like surface antigen